MFTGTTKAGAADDRETFLRQTLEARQARELERRQANAATIILAHYRSYKQRSLFRENLTKRIDSFQSTGQSTAVWTHQHLLEVYRASRELMFIFRPANDKASFDRLCQHIINSMESTGSSTTTTTTTTNQQENENQMDPQMEKPTGDIVMGGQEEEQQQQQQHPMDTATQEGVVCFASLALDKSQANSWFANTRKVLHACCKYLSTNQIDSQTDIQATLNYMKMIDLLTLAQSWPMFKSPDPKKQAHNRQQSCAKFCHELLQDLVNNGRLYHQLNGILSKTLRRCNTYLQKEIVQLSIIMTLRPLIEGKFDRKTTHMFIMHIMRIPCLIYHLQRLCPDTLDRFRQYAILNHMVDVLIPEQDSRILINTLEVNLTLCLLANMVHLAMVDTENLREIRCDYVVVLTRMLEHFQKYVMIKKSSNTHWHPILGWLSQNVDKTLHESMEHVKTQLYYLWNIKFIKILFVDLIEANELIFGKSESASGQPKHFQQSTPVSRLSPKQSSASRYGNLRQSVSVDSPSSTTTQQSFNFIKRVVERAASTMNKSLGHSYMKSSTSSGPMTNNKLMSQPASNVALVCYMYHTCLSTLTQIKRDILAGLCLHDFILPNLWHFICSLGPNHGLKAFLDHLTIYTKTSAPEFHILILFCECATHLISILDDSEVYEKQKPFCIDDLKAISGFLNNFVFRVIWNNLIAPSSNNQKPDPLLTSTHTILIVLYKRDCRRMFAPANHWLIKDIRISSFLKDLEAKKASALTIMRMIPHILPHKERVMIFRRYVSLDKQSHPLHGPSAQITIHRSRVVENGYQQLARLPPSAMKGLIRVKFINEQGLDEAGVDQDGVFKEFLEDTIKRVFDPTLNLFKSTSEQRLYPSPTSHLHMDVDHELLFEFVGKMLGKAVYEGIVVDVPFASFFLSQVLGQQQSLLYSWIDELPSLDPELYKSLTYIKHYEGDVAELDLTFSIDQDIMGKIETFDLEPGGRSIPVTRESRVRYIHSVAKYRMHCQIHKQTEAFIRGFRTIIKPEWLAMFSTPEFQRLISGDNNPIDIGDLRKNTKYFGGFHSNHRVINWLWDILEKDFSAEEHRLFLKFVTSCSKPPLLGFANLEPPFTIRCVEVSDDQDLGDTVGSVLRGFFAIRRSDPVDRLPTSSTCFNLLKLPNYQRRSTLREKLRYAIRSNAGFELS